MHVICLLSQQLHKTKKHHNYHMNFYDHKASYIPLGSWTFFRPYPWFISIDTLNAINIFVNFFFRLCILVPNYNKFIWNCSSINFTSIQEKEKDKGSKDMNAQSSYKLIVNITHNVTSVTKNSRFCSVHGALITAIWLHYGIFMKVEEWINTQW